MPENNKNKGLRPPPKSLMSQDEELQNAWDDFIEAIERSKQSPKQEWPKLSFPEAFQEIFNRTNVPDESDFDHEKWNVVNQLLDHYFNSSIYTFEAILKDSYTRFGKGIKPYFGTLKILYTTRYLDVSDEVAEMMEDNIRGYTFEKIAKENLTGQVDSSRKVKNKPKTLPSQPRIPRYSIAYYWIDYIRTYEKGYYKELKEDGTLKQTALEKEKQYHKDVEYLESKGVYPPGGAQEVARMYLYPKLYP